MRFFKSKQTSYQLLLNDEKIFNVTNWDKLFSIMRMQNTKGSNYEISKIKTEYNIYFCIKLFLKECINTFFLF